MQQIDVEKKETMNMKMRMRMSRMKRTWN